MSSLRARKERFAYALAEKRRRIERAAYEQNLYEFVKGSWTSIDSSEFQDSWAVGALCEHLEAVTKGQTRRLLINYPPRGGKSMVASICWPAWVWAQTEKTFLSGPQVRFLCGSYGQTLSLTHSSASRRLLTSPFFQKYWGERFTFAGDQNAKTRYDNNLGGSRQSTSVGASLIGLGGDVILVDDPHNTEAVESDAERETALRWWRELSSTRLNDPKQTALVVIMQRLHENDVSGAILDSGEDWDHLMLPMRYDWPRHSITSIGWHDPRGVDDDGEPLVWADEHGGRHAVSAEAQKVLDTTCQGALLWPERFGEKEVKAIEAGLGPYMASGRLQQSPEPPGGGIFKREWWEPLPISDKGSPLFTPKYPVIASLDTAYTTKDENDFSALTIWAPFKGDDNLDKIGLVHGWAKRLEIVGPDIPRKANETAEEYKRRTSAQWGLAEWVAYSCKRFKVDKLIIENKAAGHSVAQALKNLHKFDKFDVVMFDPGDRDKVARAYSVQYMFSQGMVHAPPYSWAEQIKTEMALFPKAEHDDLVDSCVQALMWLRENGAAIRKDEQIFMQKEELRYKRASKPLYWDRD